MIHPGEPAPDIAATQLADARDADEQEREPKQTRIAESTISEVLAGKRKLNRTQIGKLARYFHVEPGAFAFAS